MTNYDAFTFDLRRQETEAGWLRVFDSFYTTVTPAWFTWLGWVAILSALQVVAARTESILPRLVWSISLLLVCMYFNALFSRLRVVGSPEGTSERLIHAFSLTLAGGLAYLASTASLSVARAFASSAQ